MEKSEEKKLIERLKSGDKDAFNEFYNLFFDKVYRYAYKRVKNREQAEDITSETFLRVIKGLKNFETRMNGGLDIWMYTIERNLIRDFFRKNMGVEILPFEEKWNLLLQPPIDDPYITIERNEIDRIVKESMNELNERYKTVLKCRFYKGMSIKEVASNLGISEANVKVLQFRALKKLKDLIKEKMGNE
ncbi:MAG: sigma-70 family RNA polymerase sigma factor [Caldisericaceae bacterium]|nr:sigma-70 family RNA polymerase sigma factor [Caldisericaceae bacterium]